MSNTKVNNIISDRRQKLDFVKSQCKSNGHPNNFKPTHLSDEIECLHSMKTKDELENSHFGVAIAGRVTAKRGPFVVIKDSKSKIQVYLSKEIQSKLDDEIQGIDIGDIFGARGPVKKSNRGDLYVEASQMKLLTKSLRPMPDKFHGLNDTEIRYRQRYLDLLVNDDVKKVMELRSKIIQTMRSFMDTNGFLEVETPMLHSIPGGASARPFVTHHNALNIDMYLRIAPELYLKKLVVGGFDRVYEINRCFRNEGLSTRHNPEFTTIEFYMAYATYTDLMDFTEEMFRFILDSVKHSTTLEVKGTTVDFANPFTRISMLDSVKAYNPSNEYAQRLNYEVLTDLSEMISLAKSLDVSIKPDFTAGQILEEIFGETVEPKLIAPTFITDYPVDISPLSRRKDSNPLVTERFELFAAGQELANGFSELNDAEDQAERFRSQAEALSSGDLEAMYYDDTFIESLEYGLPPTAGQGIGIDRLVMLLTGSKSIRDVILFPALKSKQ
ncbi:lysine--tRNA ligase [Vibrio maritimus]|uniref:lysine--tRNA ligase n=1 Tax=Vibrio maritimus TaxID=990268 RepID=UPI0040692170